MFEKMARLELPHNESTEDLSSVSQSEDECDCESETSVGVYLFTDDNWERACLQGFIELYETKQLFDLKLIVKDKVFECHRSLLAASSEYFRTMFTTDLMEKGQSEVTINGVDPVSMELVIHFLYMGKVELETDTVQNLLSAANLFQLDSLKIGCAEYMAEKLDSENCLGIYFFAEVHECSFLQEKAKDKITENFLDISETDEFLELSPKQLMQILTFDDIQVLEEDIFESVRSWLEHCPLERKPYIYDVFSHVRFMLLDKYFLYDRVKTCELLQSEHSIQAILDEVFKYKLLQNRLVECDLPLEPRLGYDYSRVIIYTSYLDDERHQALQIYAGSGKSLRPQKLSSITIPTENPTLLVTGHGTIYLAGGDAGASNFYKWSSEESAFIDCASMLVKRIQFCLVQVDDKIYALGGYNGDGILFGVDCYDEETDKWKPVAPMPKALRCFCAVAYQGKLYVFGGETEKLNKKDRRGRTELNKQTLCYDPRLNKWTVLAEMSHGRALCGCTVFSKKIYVVGGFGKITVSWMIHKTPEFCLKSVEIYDPLTDRWAPGPDLPMALCGMGVVKYRGTVYVIGGGDELQESDIVYSLNPDTNSWQRRENMASGVSETTIHSSYSVANIQD